MDGHSLKFDDERRDDSPFVPDPFPAVPGGMNPEDGPAVRMRAPTLWAALNLAAKRPDGSTPSVLISLTRNIDTFAATCADLDRKSVVSGKSLSVRVALVGRSIIEKTT